MFINPITQNVYSGKNNQILENAMDSLGIEDFQVAGFKQWLEAGRCVQKGQKGTKIIMVCDKKDKEGDKQKVCKTRTVFFKSQTAPLEGPSNDNTLANCTPNAIDAPRTSRPNHANKLRAMAERMQAEIDGKFADRLTNTPKRLAQAMHCRLEGERLQRTQSVLYALADLHDAGSCPESLADYNTKSKVYEMMGEIVGPVQNGYHGYSIGTGKPKNPSPLWDLLKPKSEEQKQAEELKHKEINLQFSNIPSYFPTPRPVIDRMIEKADLVCYMEVLEPSAGNGNICDAAKSVCGKVAAVEINHTLASILEAKGYKVIQEDFMRVHFGYLFDRVLMNPPFENLQFIDHIQKAFSFLEDHGVLVAVAPPSWNFRQDKKCAAFREWLNGLTYEVEDLPEGSFKESGTDISTQLITIYK